MDYGGARHSRKGLLDDIASLLGEGCIVSIIANPLTEASQPFSTTLSHVRDVTFALKALRDSNFRCEGVYIVLNAFSATTQFAEYMIKKLRSMDVNWIKTIVADNALSMSALLPLLSEEILLMPWSSLGTVDPHIFHSHALPKEALVLKDAVDQAMASVPKEASGGKGQVLYALSVSGTLYEYVLAERSLRYVEKLLNDYVRERVPEDKFQELLERILLNIDIHNQPLSAREISELLPYAKVKEDEIKDLVDSYYGEALNYLMKYGKAILIETPFVTYDVLPPSTNPMGY